MLKNWTINRIDLCIDLLSEKGSILILQILVLKLKISGASFLLELKE